MTIIREEEPEQLIRNKGTDKPGIKKIPTEPQKAKTVDDHLSGISDQLKTLFCEINERILAISDEVEQYTTNDHIIYKTSVNFAYVAVQRRKNRLRILLRSQNRRIEDPAKLTEEMPENYGYGKITHQIDVSPGESNDKGYLDRIMDIIYQSYAATQ